MGRFLATAAFLFAVTLAGQQKLVNSGKPMQVGSKCSEEDVQALDLDCSAEAPCPLYLELNGIGSTGTRLFLAGNVHTASTTIHSILLASEDGGKTWSEPVERIRSGGLEQFQFLDLETGWVSGALLLASPRDPFLLVTTDGGRTWRKRNVYPESRSGSIEGFWFDSRTRGLLTLDRVRTEGEGGRYESYESMTGGESWSVREVSRKPIALKRAVAPAPEAAGWRLRPDAANKSYRVETQQGERWQTVASFLVAAGSCQPPERVEPAPPPEEVKPAPPKATRPGEAPQAAR
jgi:hypothetical protein